MTQFTKYSVQPNYRGPKDLQAMADSVVYAYFDNLSMVEPNNSVLVSNCTITENNTCVTVLFSYYTNTTNDTPLFDGSLANLSRLTEGLGIVFNKRVSVQAVRVHHAWMNSSILSQFIAMNAINSTFNDFKSFLNTLVLQSTNMLPSSITGISIAVNGRLMTEKAKPRITTSNYLIGKVANAAYKDCATTTAINEIGLFSVKVVTAHSKNSFVF